MLEEKIKQDDNSELEKLFEGISSLPDYLEKSMIKYAQLNAITDEYCNVFMTYADLHKSIVNFAGGLQSLGIKKSDKICLFSENNGRWMSVDLGILKTGAVDVIRGSNAPVEELEYIIGHSDAKALVIKDLELLKKLVPFIDSHNLDFIVVMFSDEENTFEKYDIQTKIYTYDEILNLGEKYPYQKVEMSLQDDMTILYTSGTTGLPKGVLLTHKNVVYEVIVSHEGFLSQPGENTLQILPIWHAYERTAQYYNISRSCHLHFTTLNGLKKDLTKYKIDTMMSVPRIWEAVRHGIYQKLKQNSKISYLIFDFAIKTSIRYKKSKMYREKRITNKWAYHNLSWLKHKIISIFLKPVHVLFSLTVYKKLKDVAGLNFRATISGGGALSVADEFFYDAIGVNLRTGYGLTETAPVLTLRGVQDKNFLGSAGKPIRFTEIKIVDPVTFEELGVFKKGLVLARGPQIMKGYYKDEEATKAVISPDGWFNTGDLGWLTKDNNLVLVGRMKETIVLSSGENVEPVPIEEACLSSPYIEQIMLVGQDESGVGALVIPSKEALNKCGVNSKDLSNKKETLIKNETLRDLIKREINTYIKKKPNLRVFEKIKQFELLKDAFSVDNGLLSATAKIKRNIVFEKYKDIIAKMYNKKN